MEKNETIILNDLSANSLPELQGWKEKQENIVNENPFIKITDNKSYEEGKKRRTSLLKGRTEIQKQDKLVASKLKEFRGKVSDASNELIKITLPFEEMQQEEVKRYEDLKAKEKIEKERIEAERKQKIKDQINEVFNTWKTAINDLTFIGLEKFLMLDILADADTSKFEEFELDFAEKVQILTNLFNDKKNQLVITENQRLEDVRLKSEREKFEEEKRIDKEKSDKEAEAKRKEQEKIDAENKAKADELDKKEADNKKEEKRLAKIKSDRVSKEEEEKRKEQAKIDAKNKAKRIEDLKPDVEKLTSIIEAIKIPASEIPNLSDDKAKEFLVNIQFQVEELKSSLLVELEQVK